MKSNNNLTTDQANALSVLKDFYKEAKKEIKSASIASSSDHDLCASSLLFEADGFCLSLQFTNENVLTNNK
jgi:hypothetical protein